MGFLPELSLPVEMVTDPKTLERYATDTSFFYLRPQAVLFPRSPDEVAQIVGYVREHKGEDPSLAITPRGAGTDMSGGAIGSSLVLDLTRHMGKILEVQEDEIYVEAGAFFRQVDAATEKVGAFIPSYPASRELCTVGGMVGNNSGGEKSLRYGKTEEYVQELEVVLSDGGIYRLKPLQGKELEEALSREDFLGHILRELFPLLKEHHDLLHRHRPMVTKDSTGYHLYRVWDPEKGILDLPQLFVGSQGTLGVITKIRFRLVKREHYGGLLVGFMDDLSPLGDLVRDLLPLSPTSLESFDRYTLSLAFKLFPSFRKTLGWRRFLGLGISLLPDAFSLLRRMPELVFLLEFTSNDETEIGEKLKKAQEVLRKYPGRVQVYPRAKEAEKYWLVRRESFNLLRQRVQGKEAVAFIDDLVVPPDYLPEFLPQLEALMKKYGFLATIAGHMGNGNFHLVPLMTWDDPKEQAKIYPAMEEATELVLKYGGSISGEHNDGLLRGPFLEKMYPPEIMALFRQVKYLFDPQNIFNPKKKVDASWDYSWAHRKGAGR
ncbi:MAG: FAD-binding oxidoreductase [Bacillota bacterium]|nr:FAD-binding oxidoreductase [Bacillota bacterium]